MHCQAQGPQPFGVSSRDSGSYRSAYDIFPPEKLTIAAAILGDGTLSRDIHRDMAAGEHPMASEKDARLTPDISRYVFMSMSLFYDS